MLYRTKRSKSACTVGDFSKPDVQEAVLKVIINAKSDLPLFVSHTAKYNKS